MTDYPTQQAGKFLKVRRISKAIAAFVSGLLVTHLGLDASVAEAFGSAFAVAFSVYFAPANTPETTYEATTYEGSE